MRDENRPAASALKSKLSRADVLRMVGAATLGGDLLGATMAGGVGDIAKFIGPLDMKHAGTGLTYDLGAVLPLTGPGAFYGRVQASGVKLAVAHIAALGGPNFNVIYKDGKGGDPQAGVQVTRELGLANVPAMLASYAADLGSMLTGIAQYKIFTLDGGGGTSLFAQGKPYFYGALAITPNDAMPGVVRFIHDTMPHVKKVSVLGWNLGPLNAPITADINRWLESQQLVPGIVELAKIGATDYSSSIEKFREDKPDLILVSVYGDDVGNFLKQYATSGINKPLITFTHTESAQKVAGSAYEGLYVAFDNFDSEHPENGWSKIFIDEYVKANGTPPDYYAANYYEDTFIIWELIRRVLAAGGDPKDGTALDKAFAYQPWFPSVYGGSRSTAGRIAFDAAKTHSVKRRPMSIAQFRNNSFIRLATYNIGGADYSKL